MVSHTLMLLNQSVYNTNCSRGAIKIGVNFWIPTLGKLNWLCIKRVFQARQFSIFAVYRWLTKCSIRCSTSSYSCLHFVMLVTHFHIVESMSDNMNSIITVSDFFAATIAGICGVSHDCLGCWAYTKSYQKNFPTIAWRLIDHHTIHTIRPTPTKSVKRR